jgi:hypothetical protein
MIGRAPSGNLIQTFGDAIDTFNGALTDTNYNRFQQYLYSKVLIEKVDDTDFVQGAPNYIITTYLNPSEATTGYFPQFNYGAHPHPKEHKNKSNDLVGEVTGKGYYWDKYADLSSGSSGTHVRYCLRFRQNARGFWLLATALVAPI